MGTAGRADTGDLACERVQRSGIRFNAGFLYAGMWIVFLAVPVIGILTEGAALGWQLLGFAGVLLFGAAYLWLSWRGFDSTLEHRIPTNGELITGVTLLAVLGALSIPAAGPWVTAFTPFIATLVIYTRRPAVGIPIGVLIWALPSVTAFILAGGSSFWILGGPGMAMLFIIAIRITEYHEENDRRRAEELRQAEERDHIARDVHDVLGHSLTVLTVKAQLARRLIESDPDRARYELEEIERLSRQSLEEVRATVSRLKTPELPDEIEVARSTLESAGITPEVSSQLDMSGPPVLAWALREAVTNVVRHSDATRCQINITTDRMRVADDGVGVGQTREGNGLRGLRERAKTVGAGVVVGRAYPELAGTSPERPGTQIEVRLS